MRILPTLLLSLAILVPQAASASPTSDALGECLKDNTSGKDRKDLARWVFVSMAAHPDIKGLANIPDATRIETDKQIAALLTRLLTQTCAVQTRAAMQKGGQADMFSSFKSLGEVAMMELMSNPNVAAAISGYVQFVDMKKLDAVLKN